MADSGESSAEASPRPVVHVPHQQAEAAANAVPRPTGDDSAQESPSEQERAAGSEHLPEGDRAAAQGRTPEQGRVPEQEREHAHACATEPEFVWDDGIIARRARVDRTAPAEHGGRRESEAEPWTPGPRSHSPGEEGPERTADRPVTGSGFAPPWRSTVWPEDPYSGEAPAARRRIRKAPTALPSSSPLRRRPWRRPPLRRSSRTPSPSMTTCSMTTRRPRRRAPGTP
ncbi:hypothetical protein ACWV95_13715 [Streptomyces albus]